MAKMTENEPTNLFTESQTVQEPIILEPELVSDETANHMAENLSPNTPPETPDASKSAQLPKWVIVVVIVVMIALPLVLFLLTRDGGDKKAAGGDDQVQPTRTSLLSPTPQPTGKITPSPFPTDEPTPSPAGSPTPVLSPTSKATGLTSLSVDDVYFEDAQNGQKIDSTVYAGQHVNLRAKLRNNGTAVANKVITYWKMQGNLVGKNENGTVKANADAVYDDVNSLVYSGVVTKEGGLTIAYFADPDNILSEANTGDNSRSKTVTVAATRSDLELADIEYYKPDTGEKVTTPIVGQTLLIKPVVKNIGQDKQVDYEVRWWINGSKVKSSISKTWLLPGESKVMSDGYPHTFTAGTTEIRLDVNIDNPIPETNSGNNSKTSNVPL